MTGDFELVWTATTGKRVANVTYITVGKLTDLTSIAADLTAQGFTCNVTQTYLYTLKDGITYELVRSI